jgi:Leucine rich repeat N-terminal domain
MQFCTISNQRDALVKWARNLNVDAWKNSTGWKNNSTVDQCDWYGVTCTNGLVTDLSLMSNNLKGNSFGGLASNSTDNGTFITEALACSLQSLTLEGNQLYGLIPDLTLLPALQLINAANNQLNGTIPDGLGAISNIDYINLSFNSLSGLLPTSICGNSLSSLSLAHNPLTGPVNVSACSNLVLLDVSDTFVDGSLVTPINSRLNIIQLSNTPLSDISEAFDSTQVVVFNAFMTNISGSIPSQIDSLRNLYSLNLFINATLRGLSGTIPPQLFNILSLHDIDLSNNGLTGTLPDAAEAFSLTSLVVKNTCLSGSIPSSFVSTFKGTTTLDLRMNYLSCCGIGLLQKIDPDASCGGNNVWYDAYNLTAPRLPPGLKFSSILGPVIQPLGSSFTQNNSWLPSLANTSYHGLSCPFIIPEGAEDLSENFLNWQVSDYVHISVILTRLC